MPHGLTVTVTPLPKSPQNKPFHSLKSKLHLLLPSMAGSHLPTLLTLLSLSLLFSCASRARAQVDDSSIQLMTEALEWPSTVSLYSGGGGDEEFGDDEDGDLEEGAIGRRSLFWRTMRYYISYGALSANRIPCPPRSGRSYYTPNCYKARGPVHPYTRGCSRITRCRR